MDKYQELNCADRDAYLKMLSKGYQVDLDVVKSIADTLGPEEDFSSLISELEDLSLIVEEDTTGPYEDHLDDDFYDRCLG